MPEGQVLEFSGITKHFGAVRAVSDLSARVEPGVVTGFLGPNGAGKTTTLRILLGLVRASSGTATIGGRAYAALERPLQAVGAVLESSSFHPGRSAANHLKVYAQAAGLPDARVEETLGLVGLADVGGRKVGGFSLGMRQRLGLAYALLGDPGVLVLDEPANGLDPEGIKWMRGFLRQLASEGRTVFVSSHLLSEVQQTVDSVLIISQGRLVFQGALEDLADPSEFATVVDSPDRAALSTALTAAGVQFELLRSGFTVRSLDPARVGEIAASAGVPLSSLARRGQALEEVFLDLVSGARVHPTGAAAAAGNAVDGVGAVPGIAPLAPVEGTDAGADRAADDAAIDAEASTVAADLQAGSGGAPGAAIATGAAVGAAAWAATASADEQDAADAVEPVQVAGAEPEAEPPREPSVEPSPTFAVASTGVIDIIPFAGDPATDAYADGLPLDADPDVEALGAIDAELSDDEDADEPPVVDDRSWEKYVKTRADVEADAFFAAFTAAGGAKDAEAHTAEERKTEEAEEAEFGAEAGPPDPPPAESAEDDPARTDADGGDQR
ncbi:ABC transporter ATP-binding protein [Microbacterium sp.]|uniref:ABC transporter ATP-binding protein n=1 Tax=Microbacterium sp. TaxID=51671 RepID=UPI002E30FF56|nr:ABC transporter ATP-binding protein [Microbacterium sp.]HEX5730116.1 ABC transporter ATP-binding protein [Microbacterium sp.]